MAKSLKLLVIAEGIEKSVQHRLLSEQGCDQLQGYLFGKPAPIAELMEMFGAVKKVSGENNSI